VSARFFAAGLSPDFNSLTQGEFDAHGRASPLAAFSNAEAHVYAELGHNPNCEKPADVAERIDAFPTNAAQPR